VNWPPAPTRRAIAALLAGTSRPNGEQIDVSVYSRRMRYEDRDAALCAVVDITERKKAAKRIAWLARHDVLTNLSNRAGFNEQLSATIAKAEARNEPFALFSIVSRRSMTYMDIPSATLSCNASRNVSLRSPARL
jgi:hypothetical protein